MRHSWVILLAPPSKNWRRGVILRLTNSKSLKVRLGVKSLPNPGLSLWGVPQQIQKLGQYLVVPVLLPPRASRYLTFPKICAKLN